MIVKKKMPNTKIMTFISYENLFSHIKKNGLLIPSSYLKNDENIDSLVNYFIENFDSVEGIIDDDNYCIIDLKFLFEGLCAGFIWRINEISSQHLQEIKGQYGYLLEVYFVELLKKIFGEQKITGPSENGKADAILETNSHILVFEFTVEYYRFASLYSEKMGAFQEDVYRLLFNEGKHDLNARGKKDKGKFHKLNNYLEEYKNSQKTAIPILVTENYFGDYEILDRFNSQLGENIASKKLDNLKENKPLIINLDDLEIFWRISNSKNAVDQFIAFAENWRKLEDKGPYHFNFSYFVSEPQNQDGAENSSKEFFNWKQFIKKLGEVTP